MNGDIQAGGWRPIRLDYPPFSEHAPIVLSWMVTSGGRTLTRKAARLVQGRAD
jgi:hypothetical protein